MPTVTTYSPLIPPDKPFNDRSKRRSSVISGNGSIINVGIAAADLRSLTCTPPPTPKGTKFSPSRLRSNSGLALHANDDLLKQYTDYSPNGAARNGVSATGRLDSTPESRRSSVVMSEPGSAELPLPSFLGRDMFDRVMKHPETANKLWKFAVSQGCGHHIEFLMKIRDYAESLEHVVAQVAAISTSYTCVTATSPIGLPQPIAKGLNLNVKHLVASTMPSLDTLFLEPQSFIEQQIMKDVFPDFVKQQLALCTSMSLALDIEATTPSTDFPGLRSSFCLSDPAKKDNPIIFASDDFEQLSGYSRYEIVSRSCGFLQGPHTDRETILRMHQAVRKKQESVELVLNYRRDGQPFWNLLYMCPLLDAAGRPKLYMGAQVDVSSSVRSKRDVLKMLNFNPADAILRRDQESATERGRAVPSNTERGESPQSRTSSKKGFFRSFKKQPRPSTSVSPERPETPIRPGLERSLTTRTILTGLSGHTPYSRFMVLEHVPSYSSPRSPAQLARETALNKKTPPKLNISYCSQGVLDVLGLGMAADAILQKDVFDVLAEQANSPSVTKSFKSTVRDTVLSEGRSTSMELALNRVGPRRPAMSRLVPGGDDGNAARDWKTGKADNATSGRSKLGQMMTYWTPLKDAEDEVRYVMFVLSPMSVRE